MARPLISEPLPFSAAPDCIIIGGGPSLTLDDVTVADAMGAVNRAYIIGINDAYRISRQLRMLYVADLPFAKHHAPAIAAAQAAQSLPFQKWTAGAELAKSCPDWRYIDGDGSALDISTDRRRVTLGQHSGFQSLNIALLMGFKRIVLLGYDCGLRDAGGARHWFGNHPAGVAKNSPYKSWQEVFERNAPGISKFGAEVINASRFTTLTCFRRQSIDEIYLRARAG